MISSIRKAYGAGNRAGRAEPNTVYINGLCYLTMPQCPFKPSQFICRTAWRMGMHNGMVRRLAK